SADRSGCAMTTLDQARLQPAASWVAYRTSDWLARAAVILVFTAMAFVSVSVALHAATNWNDQPLDYKILYVASRMANALFLGLAAATAVTRLRPLRKAAGLQ